MARIDSLRGWKDMKIVFSCMKKQYSIKGMFSVEQLEKERE